MLATRFAKSVHPVKISPLNRRPIHAKTICKSTWNNFCLAESCINSPLLRNSQQLRLSIFTQQILVRNFSPHRPPKKIAKVTYRTLGLMRDLIIGVINSRAFNTTKVRLTNISYWSRGMARRYVLPKVYNLMDKINEKIEQARRRDDK